MEKDWNKDKRFTNVYYKTNNFNGYQYNIIVTIEESDKTLKYWISASSGKKKRDFYVFDDKSEKSLGGIKALVWLKESMLEFPIFYKNRVYKRKEYICINWSDSRRRDIYSRLQKEGFIFMNIDGNKCLMKKIKIN